MASPKEKPAIEGGAPVRESVLPYATQWIRDEEAAAVEETLRSAWLTTGPKVAEFERRFAEFTKAPHAVAVSSCTAALQLSVCALGIGPGDEVVTTPLTFAATALSIVHAGAKPVFADILEDTLNVDPAEVERAITPRTKAIMPVHYAGNPCDMDALRGIASERGLKIVEDAAHAVGAAYKGEPIGATGDMTCFSFHAVKNLTCGEGGMITLSDEELKRKLVSLRFFGIPADAWKRENSDRPWVYNVEEAGFKCNMMDIQAALGLAQLERMAEFRRRREDIAAAYAIAFADEPAVIPPAVTSGAESAWHLYVIRIRPGVLRVDRDQVLRAFHAENIRANVHYLPLHHHPYFRKAFGVAPGDMPVADRVADQLVTLPLFPKMTDADVASVITAAKRIFNYYRA